MSSSAFTLMLLAMGIVTGMTAYFFWRVLTAKPKHEPDSYENE
jgi:heme/copper-type cytochrome/quinol oxidase subunit 2